MDSGHGGGDEEFNPGAQPIPSSSSLFDSFPFFDANPFIAAETSWPRPPRPPSSLPDTSFEATTLITAASSAILPVITDQPPPPPPPRSSKKRSRASRRAPTTVLTTDTTNFRAMVQEFTGIPAAPFATSSLSSSRSRLSSSFVLRPFAQRSHPTTFGPFTSVTCSSSTIATSSSSLNANICIPTVSSTTSTNPTASNDYQLPHDLGFTFPLMNTAPKFDLPGSAMPALADKSSPQPPQLIASAAANFSASTEKASESLAEAAPASSNGGPSARR